MNWLSLTCFPPLSYIKWRDKLKFCLFCELCLKKGVYSSHTGCVKIVKLTSCNRRDDNNMWSLQGHREGWRLPHDFFSYMYMQLCTVAYMSLQHRRTRQGGGRAAAPPPPWIFQLLIFGGGDTFIRANPLDFREAFIFFLSSFFLQKMHISAFLSLFKWCEIYINL